MHLMLWSSFWQKPSRCAVTNLYNLFYTVNTQQYISTVILYVQSGHITATCFDRKRSSSGQYRTFLMYNKVSSQWDPIECSLYCTSTLNISLLAWRWPFTVETCCRNVTWLYMLYHCTDILLCIDGVEYIMRTLKFTHLRAACTS